MGKKKFDVTQVIKNADGTDAQSVVPTEKRCDACRQFLMGAKPFTLRMALVRCLVNDEVDPKTGRPMPASSAERYRRVRLAFRIEDYDKVSLSLENITMLKELSEKFLSAVAMVRVQDILDPPDQEELKVASKDDEN